MKDCDEILVVFLKTRNNPRSFLALPALQPIHLAGAFLAGAVDHHQIALDMPLVRILHRHHLVAADAPCLVFFQADGFLRLVQLVDGPRPGGETLAVNPDLTGFLAPVRAPCRQVIAVDRRQRDADLLGDLGRLILHVQQPSESDDLRPPKDRAAGIVSEPAQDVASHLDNIAAR